MIGADKAPLRTLLWVHAVSGVCRDGANEVSCVAAHFVLSLSPNSLLHIQADAFPGVAARLASAIRPGGAWYMSFKLGEGERLVGGRLFVDHAEASLRLALEPLLRAGAHQQLSRSWTSATPRGALGRVCTGTR